MNDLFSLENRKALVTGGAQGIGYVVAVGMAKAGADVAIVDIQDMSKVEADIKGLGRKCVTIKGNLFSKDDLKRIVAETVQGLGGLDILFNSAGLTTNTPSLDFTEEEWEKTMGLNAKSVFFLSQEAARHMKDHGGGSIVNVSSTFGLVGFPNRIAYCASKAAVTNMTKTLAIEWAPYGIRVNAIAPGAARTPGRAELFAKPEFYNKLVEKFPMGRVAEPEEMVGPVIFLASKASSFVTGDTLLVDGGYCAQ